MVRRLGWIVIIAAAAAGGCLSGSGAIRGETVARTAAEAPSPRPLRRSLRRRRAGRDLFVVSG